MVKIKLHSITDLITNSSTTIFTYSEGTIQPLKEMINEILKTFGVTDKTCDDMFDTVILKDDWYDYRDWVSKNEDEFLKEDEDELPDVEKLYEEVKAGKTPKPEWFTEVEEEESRCDYFKDSNYLYIIPKDEKYAKMAQLIQTFLYSTDHEATRDG